MSFVGNLHLVLQNSKILQGYFFSRRIQTWPVCSGLDRDPDQPAFGLIPSQILYLVLWVAILLSRWLNKARAEHKFKKKNF